MGIENLIIPRYKVIARYPNSIFEVGIILTKNESGAFESDEHYATEHELSEYPHLFKPLQWWEGREEKDMPEYVKLVGKNYKEAEIGKVVKINIGESDNTSFRTEDLYPWSRITFEHWIPATESEYNSQPQ